MNLAHLTGKKVRLTRWDFELDTEALARWSQDSEYIRLANSDPARIWTAWQTKEWFEKRTDLDYCFAIHTVAEDKLIGNLDFDGIHPVVHNAWVGIGIGERDYWSQGYGTEAMALLMRYGFDQLDLRRVSLTVFEYNTRAIQSYQKLGFVEEGRLRQWMLRGGRRWDLIYMGLLRTEWQAVQSQFLED